MAIDLGTLSPLDPPSATSLSEIFDNNQSNRPQSLDSARNTHFGRMLGSPPGLPGGGITGMRPPSGVGALMSGSTPGGGQMTPSERASCSLNDLPVVSALCSLLSCPTVRPCCAQAFGSRTSLDIISGGALGNGETGAVCASESAGISAAPNSSAILNLGK